MTTTTLLTKSQWKHYKIHSLKACLHIHISDILYDTFLNIQKKKKKKSFVATVLISLLCYRIQVGGGEQNKKKDKNVSQGYKKQTNKQQLRFDVEAENCSRFSRASVICRLCSRSVHTSIYFQYIHLGNCRQFVNVFYLRCASSQGLVV